MAVSATDNLEPDRAAVARVLAALTRAPRGPVEVWPRLDSTNAELLRRGAGQPDRAVLIADAQSAGRGRLKSGVWIPSVNRTVKKNSTFRGKVGLGMMPDPAFPFRG